MDKSDKKGLTPYLFAIKHGKNSIAELLAARGVNTQVKVGHDKKAKSKKTKTEEEGKIEIEEIQKARKCFLVKMNEYGEKIVLTNDEIEDMRKNYPDVMNMIENPTVLEEAEKNAPEE